MNSMKNKSEKENVRGERRSPKGRRPATAGARQAQSVCLSWLLAFVGATVLAAVSYGQDSGAAGPVRVGMPQDWSHRYVVYTNGGSAAAAAAAQNDPRAYFSWRARTQAHMAAGAALPMNPNGNRLVHKPSKPHVDWSMSLGGIGQAPNMSPAKYSFDINAAPDCVNDYVVYPLNGQGSFTQANVVAFNYLYSGTTPANGICNNLAGNGTSAKVMFAYRPGFNPHPASPALSLDGKKLAVVESRNYAVLHVIAWAAGQGSVTSPFVPGSTQMTNLTLTGAVYDTNSPVFVDYQNDAGYIGSDNGKLLKVTGIFKGTPALAGTPWPLTAGTAKLTGPVYDQVTGNVFVGSANGLLYGFSANGTPLANSPLLVGNGASFGGIVDPPIVDSSNGLVYAFSGGNGTNAVVIQASTSNLALKRTVAIGTANTTDIHVGAFNDAYYSQTTNQIGTTAEWFLYVCGVAGGGGTTPVLYRIGFDANRNLNAAVDSTQVSLSSNAGEECSPLTEFMNGVDRVFLSLRTSQVVEYFDVSSSRTPTRSASTVSEAGGTGGIIVDNVSTQPQASSIYFGTLATDASCGGNRCAVKLTQSGLQ